MKWYVGVMTVLQVLFIISMIEKSHEILTKTYEPPRVDSSFYGAMFFHGAFLLWGLWLLLKSGAGAAGR